MSQSTHPLHTSFTWWYSKKMDKAHPSEADYEKCLRQITTVKTVEDFWNSYSYLVRPNDMTSGSHLDFFRTGVKPVWEDAHNCKGGKVIFRVQKAVANFYWEELLLAFIGGYLPCVEDVVGMIVTLRFSAIHFAVWNRDATNHARNVELREGIRAQLRLPAGLLDYKAHETHPLLQHLATQQPPPRPVPSGSANNSSSTSSSAASSLPPPPTVAPPPPPSQQAPAIPTSPPPPPTVPPATTAAGEKNGPPSAAAAPPAEKA